MGEEDKNPKKPYDEMAARFPAIDKHRDKSLRWSRSFVFRDRMFVLTTEAFIYPLNILTVIWKV